MHNALTSTALGALALAAALACSGAYADPGWIATQTLGHEAAATGLALPAGTAVHIAVTLQMRHADEMDALAEAVLSGRSARHLARAEFLDHYAPTPAQVEAVVAHLRGAGFTHVEVAANRMLVSADGSAGAVQAGFKAELRHVVVNGRDAYANASDVQVPSALAGIVNAVHGLQNVHAAHPLLAYPDASLPAASSAVGHNPKDFPTIYDADGLPPASDATIGIISEGDISQTLTDLAAFATGAGYAPPQVEQIVVGTPGTDTQGVIEWNMDSQTALSAAGGAVKKMVFYVSTTLEDAPLTEAYNRAVSDNVAQAINVSLGECETDASTSGIEASNDAIFKIAVAQGQVFSVSSGDSGSFQCGSKTGGQSYPAVSPYVIAVGGTLLKTTGATTWAGETVWACNSSLGCQFLGGGTGGGASVTEAAPAWQKKSGVLGTSTKRGIPDISFDGDPSSGALVLNGNKTTQVGGTSLSAPLFAGFWARLQSAHANALGYPAASIYRFGIKPKNAKALFHDVTSGTNGGYTAAKGWDYASGFGTLDVGKFSAFIDAHPGF